MAGGEEFFAVGGGLDFFGEFFVEVFHAFGAGGGAFDQDAGDGADEDGEVAGDFVEEVGVAGAFGRRGGGGGRGGGGAGVEGAGLSEGGDGAGGEG